MKQHEPNDAELPRKAAQKNASRNFVEKRGDAVSVSVVG